ncbi:hypothetical protein G3545_28730 [Starkeya sp. ORNL1]|uniref:hypothetical protein n=1 Tax=Starkeya sp. ORNL1 TaxID=2709380 RepID=UPI00146401EF|nr:hypothetical protein [Starkeya sp. ORNL1]QJP17278.1 hypothetical protein G3545_28730 [Starkeya sp. ORNL1]
MMNLGLVLVPILAGVITLFVGATLLVHHPAPRRWMVGTYVLLEIALLGTGLFLLPFALRFDSF